MATTTIRTTASRVEVRRAIRQFVSIVSGKEQDQHKIAAHAQLRLGVEFLGFVKIAFVQKARGGTDDAGISWPPLSKKYLAYSKGPPSTRRAGKASPGGKDGYMSKTQLEQWWNDYRQSLAWLVVEHSIGKAKGIAAAIAWTKAKKRGVKTKLDVLGNRRTEILRDRGILLASLQPGIVRNGEYTPAKKQIARPSPGAITVGTSVPYAAAHHKGLGNMPKRPLWPEPDRIPEKWWATMLASSVDSIATALQHLIGSR